MKLKILNTLLIASLFLSACSEDSQGLGPKVLPEAKGTSSGGGGFVDTSARVFLDLAKYSLATIVENSSDEIYKNFPSDKNKAWLIEVIKKTQIKDVDQQRYGRTLKFNYDQKSQQIFATRAYVQVIENQRPWTLSSKAKMEVVLNLHLDILHEISHLYGVGISESTDYQSAEWAKKLLFDHIGTEKVTCINRDEITYNEGSNAEEKVFGRAIVFNPSTGFSYFGRIEYENQWETFEEYKDPALRLILPPGMQYESVEADFTAQYFSLVNLALKHISLDQLKGVVSTPEDLKPEAIVDVIMVYDQITDWNLVTLGNVKQVDSDWFRYISYDELDMGSTTTDFNGNKTENYRHLFNQEYTFEVNRKTNEGTFKINLLPTDSASEEFLKNNQEEVEQSLKLQCEYNVKTMAL